MKQSISKWFVRIAVTASLPVILPWTFFSTLIREIASAFRFAWLAVRGDIGSYLLMLNYDGTDESAKRWRDR